MIALVITAFSFRKVSFRVAIQAGLPSPVSMSRRSLPVPTRYVLVPGTILGHLCYVCIRVVLVVTSRYLVEYTVDWSVRLRKQQISDSTYMNGSRLRTTDTNFAENRQLGLR